MKVTFHSTKANSGQNWAALIIAGLLGVLVLVACGEEPTPVPPTPTPTPRFQLETNNDLFYTLNIPFNWNKSPVDANSVIYVNPKDQVELEGVISKNIDKLGPESQQLLQERVSQLKSRFSNLKEDGSSDSINLGDATVRINRLNYSNNGADLIQYLAQVNNVKANRAYLLYAVTNAKTAEVNRPLYLDSFRSFTSTASASPDANSVLADPTVVAGNKGGKVVIRSGQEYKGRYLTLVAWETPPLDLNKKAPRITGYFPKDYTWRVLPFRINDLPFLYLESPIVDRTTSQASMQFTVVPNAFATGTPSADDWKKFYEATFDKEDKEKGKKPGIMTAVLNSYGSNVKVDPVATVPTTTGATIYRAPFIARNDDGSVKSRGTILFNRSGTNGIISVLSLSPAASINQTLLESFDADFQTMISSFTVK